MKNTLKILPSNEGSGFYGEVIQENKVIYTSQFYSEPMQVSRDLQKFLASQGNFELPKETTNSQTLNKTKFYTSNKIVSQKSCCS